MMNRISIISLFSTVVLLLFSACGGDDTQPSVKKEFHLAEVQAENLRSVGMAVEMEGDTTGMSNAGERVPSPDKSKVAYCEGVKVYIADADGATSKLLHDAGSEPGIKACFHLQWASNEELSFTQAKTVQGDTLQLMTVIITLGNSSESE